MTPDLTKLTAVADMLETLPARLGPNDLFQMSVFVFPILHDTSSRSGFRLAYGDDRFRSECGTAACAAGWTAKLLPELGLRLPDGGGNNVTYRHPTGGWLYGFYALEECFGLTIGQAEHLFGSDNPNDPIVTADRIRDFIAEHTPEEAT